MNHNQIWKFEWSSLIFEYLNETQSFLKILTKQYHTWLFERKTIIFENLIEKLSYLKIWIKHSHIWLFKWITIKLKI